MADIRFCCWSTLNTTKVLLQWIRSTFRLQSTYFNGFCFVWCECNASKSRPISWLLILCFVCCSHLRWPQTWMPMCPRWVHSWETWHLIGLWALNQSTSSPFRCSPKYSALETPLQMLGVMAPFPGVFANGFIMTSTWPASFCSTLEFTSSRMDSLAQLNRPAASSAVPSSLTDPLKSQAIHNSVAAFGVQSQTFNNSQQGMPGMLMRFSTAFMTCEWEPVEIIADVRVLEDNFRLCRLAISQPESLRQFVSPDSLLLKQHCGSFIQVSFHLHVLYVRP